MSDPRAPIFAFLSPYLKTPGWGNRELLEGMDAHLDRLGVPRGADPAPTLAPSRAAYEIIKLFEGYATAQADGGCKAYPDPGSGGDPWTIGYGSTGADIRPGTVWTQQQAQARLEQDVHDFAKGIAKALVDAPTEQCEFDAMVSLAYNIGLGAFGGSTLLRLHKAGDNIGAAAQFQRWNRAAGKVMAGLTRRRLAEAALYRGRA